MMNALLVNSNVLDNSWEEALLTTCYLQNGIHSKEINKTLYELW